MNRMLPFVTAGLVVALCASSASAQSFDTVGTRAAGMGGAFVAVADDASAAYWNPAGLASGSYFSLLLDRNGADAVPSDGARAGSRSGFIFALGAPALSLSYYRVRSTTLADSSAIAEPAGSRNVAAGEVRLDNLVTHHAGVTVVQSILRGVAVGATLKLVRGIAATSVQPDGDRDELLGRGDSLIGQASNKFDADLGIMAVSGRVKAGLTVRNLTEPDFKTAGGETALRLERQARAGLAVMPVDGWIVAADLDLLETAGLTGPERDFAIGTEGRIARRAFVRAGARLNSAGDDGRRASLGLGGSYAVTGSVWVDGQVTVGSERAPRGWGVSARFVY